MRYSGVEIELRKKWTQEFFLVTDITFLAAPPLRVTFNRAFFVNPSPQVMSDVLFAWLLWILPLNDCGNEVGLTHSIPLVSLVF